MREEELFERYISASMEAADSSALKELLKNDSAASRRFVEFIEDTAHYISIAEEMGSKESAKKARIGDTFSVNREKYKKDNVLSRRKNIKRLILSIAALTTIVGVLFSQYLKELKTVGTINSFSVSLERSGFDYSWGNEQSLLQGDLVTALQDSLVTLKDGSQIHLSKGATCQIVMTKKGLLVEQRSGVADYVVAKQANGQNFRVKTDKLQTTVIGTRFTVEAQGQQSKVRVLEGLVKVDDMESLSYYVNSGEYVHLSSGGDLLKKTAYKGMQLSSLLTDFSGLDYDRRLIEEKKYILLLYAAAWDPASRSFIHSLKKFYQKKNKNFEVVFMNDQEAFARDYEMPWAIVQQKYLSKAEKVVGGISGSAFPLNLTLIDQQGNILSSSVKGKKWQGVAQVLEMLEENP